MVKLPRKQKTDIGSQKTDDNSLVFDNSATTNPQTPPVQPPPQQSFDPVTGAPTGGIGSKERELFQRQDELQLEEIRKDLELAPEMKEAGVELLTHEELELPPSVKQMGVTQTVEETSFPQAAPVVVPLADDKIIQGTGVGTSVWASLTWLAQWCLRQLKKAHVKLKKIHGKIVRVVTK